MAKVLIIEDDPVMQKMYQRVFKYENFEVEEAIDGQVGLEKVKTIKPDMVLLDIMMPVMSGLQVLDAMKADPTTAEIPVIVFTNLAGKQDADAVLAKGAIQCIHKSQVNPKQVAQMVKDELGKRGVVIQSPEQGGAPTQMTNENVAPMQPASESTAQVQQPVAGQVAPQDQLQKPSEKLEQVVPENGDGSGGSR